MPRSDAKLKKGLDISYSNIRKLNYKNSTEKKSLLKFKNIYIRIVYHEK